MQIDSSVSLASLQQAPSISKKEKNLKILKQKSDDFEAMILKNMLDIAMDDEKNALFGKPVGNEIYRSMYHDSLSRELAGNFGYSKLLFEFLKKNL